MIKKAPHNKCHFGLWKALRVGAEWKILRKCNCGKIQEAQPSGEIVHRLSGVSGPSIFSDEYESVLAHDSADYYNAGHKDGDFGEISDIATIRKLQNLFRIRN